MTNQSFTVELRKETIRKDSAGNTKIQYGSNILKIDIETTNPQLALTATANYINRIQWFNNRDNQMSHLVDRTKANYFMLRATSADNSTCSRHYTLDANNKLVRLTIKPLLQEGSTITFEFDEPPKQLIINN